MKMKNDSIVRKQMIYYYVNNDDIELRYNF